MTLQLSKTESESYTIVGEMNEHGAMTIIDPENKSTFHVVEYDDDGLRRELSALEAGQSVELDLDRAGVRANVWRASRNDRQTLTA